MNAHRFVMIGVVVLFAGRDSRASAQDSSWIGESVIFTKPAGEFTFWDSVDGQKVELVFAGLLPIKVRDELDGRLRIHDGYREGWVDKADFVLARDAVAFFERRAAANANDTWALFMRAQSWYQKRELDKAIKDFDEYIRQDPEHPRGFLGRGIVWLGKREYDKAIKDFDEVIRLDPVSVIGLGNRGLVWIAREEYDKAIKDFDEGIRLDPKLPMLFYNRGDVWFEKRQFDKAIEDYDEAIGLDGRNADTFVRRGFAWGAKKEFDKAIQDFDKAIRLDSTSAWYFSIRGEAWNSKQDYDKAIKDFDEAVRLDPKHSPAWRGRGSAWFAKSEFDKAIKDFDETIRLSPKDAWTHFSRAVAQMLTRRPAAIKGFQDLRDLEGWKGRLAPYAIIYGHLAARKLGDEAAAKRFLDDAADKFDESWPLAALKYLRGEIDEAALLAQATDDDKRTEARCYLGLDHALKGNTDRAQTHLRWVREHGSPNFIECSVARAELERLEKSPK